MDDGNVICQSCEREVDDSLTWCPACGATVAPPPPVSDSERIGGELGDGRREPPWAVAEEEAWTTPGPGDTSIPERLGRLPSNPIRPTGRAPSGPNRAKVMAIALVVLVLIGAGAGLLFLVAGDDEVTAGNMEAAALQRGDCWNDVPGEPTQILEVPVVPCDQPHDNEVFAVVEIPGAPGSPFPDIETLDLLGGERCLQHFAGYTGEMYEFSSLEIWMLFPTLSSWEIGDREVICSLYRMDLQKMTGSARATTP